MGGEEVGGKSLGVEGTGSQSLEEVERNTDGGGQSPVIYQHLIVTLFSQPNHLFALA